MIDARLSVGLPTHPKTKKLIRRLGDSGAWRLVCLFLWCAANKPDGDLAGMSVEDIELAADWCGEEGAFVAALREVRFLDGEPGAFQIHDWAEHNPWAAGSDARADKARWGALVRHHGHAEAARQMPEYAARIGRAQPAPDVPDSAELVRGECADVATGNASSATSMPLAGFSNAPSPSPSPLPKSKESHAPTEPEKPGQEPPPDARALSPAVEAVRAMRAAGMQSASTADPRLAEALAAGVTPAELGDAARDAVERGRGVAYAMATAMGRRRDAAAMASGGVAGSGPPGGRGGGGGRQSRVDSGNATIFREVSGDERGAAGAAGAGERDITAEACRVA